jgi:hypothetical protein
MRAAQAKARHLHGALFLICPALNNQLLFVYRLENRRKPAGRLFSQRTRHETYRLPW